jgi:hypothetical protein
MPYIYIPQRKTIKKVLTFLIFQEKLKKKNNEHANENFSRGPGEIKNI